ncbi:MAG: hypothetical protein C5B53_08515 [Candidatus Melainabacteria bacterium]|nr:MAG: hypothetical protein C5B53_08515 [Candidatus Melainabacteria bacterium]
MHRRVLLVAAFSLVLWQSAPAFARHHHASADQPTKSGSRARGQRAQTEAMRSGTSGRHRGHRHEVAVFSGTKRTLAHLFRHHMRHHGRGHELAHQSKTRYAYPLGFFLANPPSFDQSGFPADLSASIRSAFAQGLADTYPPRALVKAGVVAYHPLRGGIFWRREQIKYVIVHSTEDARPLTAPGVIESWSSMGRRHPGAQYVIDREGNIYQALDPDLGSVHVNIFKTLPGINNDDSVGIEMVHMHSQEYPDPQVSSLIRLVTYLQGHYHVPDENVVTHRYAQQGDHTDPVNFQWDRFIADKGFLQQKAAGLKVALLNNQAVNWETAILPLPEAFLELHRPIRLVPQAVAAPPLAASKLPSPSTPTIARPVTPTLTSPSTSVLDRPVTTTLASPSTSVLSHPVTSASVLARPVTSTPTSPSSSIPAAGDSYIKVKTDTAPTLVAGPAPAPAAASPPRKIPISLPLRGPIELDPAAVNLLEHAVQPASEIKQPASQSATTKQPFNNGLPGAPVPTGRQ